MLLLHDHTRFDDILRYLADQGLRVAHRRNDVHMLTAVVDIDPDGIVLDVRG